MCLTTVGPAVVPIPYSNSAKSKDLVNGSKTVTADGGNSIAIQGSYFAKSTGDADGDKKGVGSGTIEAEAEFISWSPTVMVEGKGICRLSDQMTMNAGNALCMGGVQNPSVEVTEEDEGTYTVDIKARYPNGPFLKEAPFELIDGSGAVLASGQLDGSGMATVSGLENAQVRLIVEESGSDFVITPTRSDNAY